MSFMAIPTTLFNVLDILLFVRMAMTCLVVIMVELRSTSTRLQTPLAKTAVGTDMRRTPLMSRYVILEFGRAEKMARHCFGVRNVSLILRLVRWRQASASSWLGVSLRTFLEMFRDSNLVLSGA